MDFNCKNIESFFSQIPVNEYTEKLKAEIYDEFIEKYNEFINEGYDEKVAFQIASEWFNDLDKRFPKLIEERDFIIEVNRCVNIIYNCQGVCYLTWFLLVGCTFAYPFIGNRFNIEAGSIGDGLMVGFIVLIVLVMFVASRIPDRKIPKKVAKYIIKQKKTGLQLGNIGLTYFLSPYVFSTTVIIFGVIAVIIELL